ncbi:MAG TPA: superoxide dismutase family protein [Gemmatimonadales bacterium]|jgi:Cu-Zn family superoxide dismutase|nr:superoxide dismutase family protein [Gemmatimonadales bacterium]
MTRPAAAGLAAGLALGLGCGHGPAGSAPVPAPIAVRDTAGTTIGEVRLARERSAVRLTLEVRGLSPGLHGFHVHQVGRCLPPDFASAGPHDNPTGKQHGRRNPAGPHRGDLANLVVDASGLGRAVVTLPGASPAPPGSPGLALVIHAEPDDEVTDPAGNAGRRIACAELPLTWPVE